MAHLCNVGVRAVQTSRRRVAAAHRRGQLLPAASELRGAKRHRVKTPASSQGLGEVGWSRRTMTHKFPLRSKQRGMTPSTGSQAITCRVRRTVQRTMLSRSSWVGCTLSPRIFPRGRSCWRLILDGVTLRQRAHGYRGAGLLYVDLTDLSRHRGRLSWCGSRSDAADTRQGLLELLKKTLKICDSNAVCKSSTGLRLENCAASSQAHEGEGGRRV